MTPDRKKYKIMDETFSAIVKEAVERGPMLQCDDCLEWWPVPEYIKENFMSAGGVLLCSTCSESYD